MVATPTPPAAGMLTLRLHRISWEAPGVVSIEMRSIDGSPLPEFRPGAHLDLSLTDGRTRKYSLCGDPADRAVYRLGVRKVEGGRVSSIIHRQLRPGMLLSASEPRDAFPFHASERYLFVAGGIGITPLLPMMREATRAGAAWTLIFCARRAEDAPFLDEARSLAGTVELHASEASGRLDIMARLKTPQDDTLVYCCGPDGLMRDVEAAAQAWPKGGVHFEWFQPKERPLDEIRAALEVVCARTGLTVIVPPNKSILEVLRENGIDAPHSCEQGICGSCACRVLQGIVDHRDSVLSEAERVANDIMMICVSRAKSARLVLDI